MKYLILLVICVVSDTIYGQTDFEKGMSNALTLMQEGKFDQAENLFERIANAEEAQWLPHYYLAQINSLKSWNVKDIDVLKPQLEKARTHLEKAKSISESNPELLVMEALILTNWVAFDGQTYGMKYSGKVNELYSKAKVLAPDNPRVVYSKAQWDMGTAQFFGQDPEPYCKDIERSLELFANFKPESAIHPQWGAENAKQILNNCKS